MLFNFLKITLRNLLKNKSYVIINLAGLGFSLACCIVAYLNYNFASNFDKNHENYEQIYKIQGYKVVQGQNIPYGITPLPLGAQIEDKITGISRVCRYDQTGLVLKKDLKVFNQGIGFADDEFLEMFSFPLRFGDRSALLDRSKLLLSYNTAQTYFGDVDPTGETINIVREDGEQIPMTVGGVFEEIPMNSSIHFNALTHFDNYIRIRKADKNDWADFIAATFVMTEGTEFPQNLLDDINSNYIAIQNEARDELPFGSYFLEPLETLGIKAENVRANWLGETPPQPAIIAPGIMAVLMLLIACFNFTNTSIAISSKRLKEIGIRKVMGSGRQQLIFQFMGENLILSTMAMLVGLLLAYFLVPAYSAMWDFINLELSLTNNTEIYFFLGGLLVFTSLIAGGYPSFYISSYQPVKILRGNLSLGGANLFSKVLLGLQYLFTMIALISALAFSNNAEYQGQLDIGFEKENLIAVRVENRSEYEKFNNLVTQLPEIDQAVGTTHHIGWWTYSRTIRAGEKEVDSDMMDLSLDYDEIMNLKILEGRYFDKDLFEFDRQNSLIVNEQTVKEFGWEEPVGQVVQVDDSTRLTVVGVMKDFYMYGFFDTVDPAGFRLGNKDAMNFLVVKSQQNPKEVYEKLEATWYEVAPTTPFNADYQDEAVKQSDLVNTNIMVMFRFLGVLALALSCIGLYTLVSLNIIKRIKEIGVRKVLGATVNQLVVLINLQFFWLLIIAAVLGAVASYFAIDLLMASIFSVYKTMSVATALFPMLFLLVVAIGIASGRIFKSAVQNPVKSLRYE